MLIELIENPEGIKETNEFYKKFRAENPDDEYIQNIKDMESLDDEFLPYQKWIESATKEEKEKYFKIKDIYSGFKGIYIADLNSEHSLERLTFSKIVDIMHTNRDLYWRNYGVCDNASQAIDYYNNLISERIINDKDNFIIMLVPIFKEGQPSSGGWRWHKWGPYIGVQNPRHEYLYNEEDIEMIYCFSIIQVE